MPLDYSRTGGAGVKDDLQGSVVLDERDDLPVFIHSELDDYGLDPYEFRVYSTVARRAGRNGAFFEGLPKMAKRCKMSLAKARVARNVIEAAGLISVTANPGKTSTVKLTPKRAWARPDDLEFIREQFRGTPTKNTTPIESDTPTRSDSPTPIGSGRPPLSDSSDEGYPSSQSQEVNPSKNSPGSFVGQASGSSPAPKRQNGYTPDLWVAAHNDYKPTAWPEVKTMNGKSRSAGVKAIIQSFGSEESGLQAYKLVLTWIRTGSGDNPKWWRDKDITFENFVKTTAAHVVSFYEKAANAGITEPIPAAATARPASGNPVATEPEIRAEHRRLYEQENMILAASGFRRFGVTTVTDLMRVPAEAADYLAWLKGQSTPQFDDYPMAM